MKTTTLKLLIGLFLISCISCEKDEITTTIEETSEKGLNILPAQVLYEFPFRGEDIKPKERVYTKNHAAGIQQKGKDIHVKRYLGNNKWTHLKAGTNGSKNSDDVIYGKPIYAIASGKIIGGWRNAPENPADGTKHPFVAAKLIPGGGNMLWVEHTDGSRVLYAHMIPGSIPLNLCDIQEATFPASTNNENQYVMYDPADQVNIVKGQFLGRVGNSGNSTGSHLHIHVEKNGSAKAMKFRKGSAKTYVHNQTTLHTGWQSFNGQEIPQGRVLIDAPRRREYRMMDFESYRVGNRQMYAGIFVPGSYDSASYIKDDWTQFRNKWSDLESKGFRMIDFDSYMLGNKRMYAGIFKPGNYARAAYFKDDWNDFVAKWSDLESRGFRMIDFESYKVGNKQMYAGIFKPGNYAKAAYFKDNWNDFVAKWSDLESKGFRMIDFESYKVGNKQMYAGIFKPGSYAKAAYFKSDWTQFRNKWSELESKGFRMIDFESYKVGSTQMYAGIFKPGSYAPAAYFKNNWEDFLEGWKYLE